MRICYWTPNAGGGAGKYERYLPHEMEKLGNEVTVFRRPHSLKGNPLTLRLLYKSDGDIIHATTQTLSMYSYPKPENFVVTVHDVYSLHHSLTARIKRSLIKSTLKRADKIIAVSEFTKGEINEQMKINEDKIGVIHLGIDLSMYKPMNKETCKRDFGLNAEEKHILIVASNAPHKRMDITEAVFEEVSKCREDLKLLKAGYGQTLEGKGIVNMGFVREERVPILYNASDVLLHTSEYEGFGMPLLEAMACGTPIVASNKAAIPEVVGDCGKLVDLDADDCVEQFAEKVLDYMDSGRSNQKGIERSKGFSWEKTAMESTKVYDAVLL